MRPALRSFDLKPSASLGLLLSALLAACSSGTDAATGGAGGGAAASTTTTSTAATSAAGSTGGGGAAPVSPSKPGDLTTYLTGDDADADVTPTGPGLILMGGGTDVDAAFVWWKGRIAGGDVVVLRTSGSDGYNDYLHADIGGCDSVETMLVTTRELADSDYVAWRLRHAEGIFLAGGDQATYMTAWKDTAVEAALMDAHARGAVIGGTSAGCAVLGELVFAAYNDTVYSDEALADPYNGYMTLEHDFLAFPALAGVVTDTHFGARDRMGRLVAFVARFVQDGVSDPALGLGVDEETALVVGPDGQGEVLGGGHVYVVKSAGLPASCEAGKPLDYQGLTYHALAAGETIALPSGETSSPALTLSASGGALTPEGPY